MDQKKRADISANPSLDKSKHTKKRKPLKLERTLELLLKHPEPNAYDANDMYGGLHLNTSVSDLQIRYGFRILRESRKVPDRISDQPAKYYWFSDEDRSKAIELLSKLRARRGANPIIWESAA